MTPEKFQTKYAEVVMMIDYCRDNPARQHHLLPLCRHKRKLIDEAIALKQQWTRFNLEPFTKELP